MQQQQPCSSSSTACSWGEVAVPLRPPSTATVRCGRRTERSPRAKPAGSLFGPERGVGVSTRAGGFEVFFLTSSRSPGLARSFLCARPRCTPLARPPLFPSRCGDTERRSQLWLERPRGRDSVTQSVGCVPLRKQRRWCYLFEVNSLQNIQPRNNCLGPMNGNINCPKAACTSSWEYFLLSRYLEVSAARHRFCVYISLRGVDGPDTTEAMLNPVGWR